MVIERGSSCLGLLWELPLSVGTSMLGEARLHRRGTRSDLEEVLVTCSAPSRQLLMLRAHGISLLAFQTQMEVNRKGLNYSFPSGRMLLVKMGVL